MILILIGSGIWCCVGCVIPVAPTLLFLFFSSLHTLWSASLCGCHMLKVNKLAVNIFACLEPHQGCTRLRSIEYSAFCTLHDKCTSLNSPDNIPPPPPPSLPPLAESRPDCHYGRNRGGEEPDLQRLQSGSRGSSEGDRPRGA